MDRPPEQLEFDIIKWLLTAVVGVLSVLYKLLHGRIAKLEFDVSNKPDGATITDMRSLMKEHRDETRNNFNSINQTLNAILLKLGDRHD